MLFVDQVVASAEGHQVGVVSRRWDGDGARAADVGVAQLVGEELELVTGETVVVPQNVVVGRPARTLEGGEESQVNRTQEREAPWREDKQSADKITWSSEEVLLFNRVMR